MLIPWGHLLLSERNLLRWINFRSNMNYSSIHEIGLNALSLKEYKNIFSSSGLDIIHFQVNTSTRLISQIFSYIRKINFLEEFFSHNIYCIMEKRN